MTVLTVTPARTLGDLKTRIADELARADLTSQIALAIDDAIDVACKNRFWFNEVRGQEIILNATEQYYSDADTDVLVEIDVLYLLIGTQRRNLRLAGNDRLNHLHNGSPSSGEPQTFSRYGLELRFWPIPAQSYTIFIDGLTRGLAMENDGDSSVWTTYAEKYVRALAKTILYADVIRNADEALKNDQLAQRYLLDLSAQTESRAMTGEMEAFGV